ncbi:hypothetical protein QOZ80_1BG0054180 [Eleusine coracana subsp. coracana]|nr:hypothetical protein QOZ80_1BG0054180 [Eleusine coracana subsp. coracana]
MAAQVQTFRTAADAAMAASAFYAAFGAAAAYPSAAPVATALPFALGYGALLFLLPFSVYALVFLFAPRYLCKMTKSMMLCAVATPAALLAAVLAVPGAAARPGGDVTLAAAAVWAVDVAAVAALGWCLTNGGYTAVAFSRQYQYANFMNALDRTPELGYSFFNIADPKAARRDAALLVAAASAACAIAGGAVVGGASSAGVLSSVTIAAAFVIFALSMCLLYVSEYLVADHFAEFKLALQRNPVPAWLLLLAPVALVLYRLVKAAAAAGAWGGALTNGAGVMWAVDAAIAVYIGRSVAREIERPYLIVRYASPEIVSAILMVFLRYALYLHVFHIIGCGGQLRWFNSAA